MKKKIFSIVLVLTLVLGLTGCAEPIKMMEPNAESVISQSLAVYGLSQATAYDVDYLKSCENLNEDELDELAEILSSRVKTEGSVVIAATQSYAKAAGVTTNPDQPGKDEIGTLVSYESLLGYTRYVLDRENGEGFPAKEEMSADTLYVDIDAKKKEVVVTMYIPTTSADKHDVKYEVIFDKNYHITSANVNVIYSTGELMGKAGINTAFGMGTVFVMLILIALIISLFGVFSGASKKKAEKKKAAASTGVDNAVKTIEANEEAEEDDTELVAVIAAAIAAFEGSSSTDGFVVRSIKRIK